jgi:phosphoribosylaminoimidazole-succinocarboxamide synthase
MSRGLPSALIDSALPLPLVRRGKVRDVYAVDDDRLLLVTTDRISAFDIVMHEPIPYKGAVLTQLTAWWLTQLGSTVKHHLITADTDAIVREVPVLAPYRDALAGRSMLCVRAEVVPIECVIRGYLSGSAWKE